MRAFEIHLNGKRLCTAGVGDAGVLTAIVHSDPRANELGLSIGGFDTSSQNTWIGKLLGFAVAMRSSSGSLTRMWQTIPVAVNTQILI
jgi:hypothetical protein